jgi:hypothetical protein
MYVLLICYYVLCHQYLTVSTIKCHFLQFQVYEGAVYMHQGANYLVEELDLASRTAFCRKADLKYYTKTRDYTDINVLGGEFVCSQGYYYSSFLYIFFIIDSSPGVVFSTLFCLLLFCLVYLTLV